MRRQFFALIFCLVSVACGSNEQANPRRIRAILHQVDVQETFFPAGQGRTESGSLAVANAERIVPNLQRLAVYAHGKEEMKTVNSVDWHYPYHEPNHIATDPTLVRGFIFPPHGLADQGGPAGSKRLAEIANLYPQQLDVPHSAPKTVVTYDAAGNVSSINDDLLELLPFDVTSYKRQILDPSVELVIRKNSGSNLPGQHLDSRSVWSNPRTEQIYQLMNPNKDIDVYVDGVATDHCVDQALIGFRDRGYKNVYLVRDATQGLTAASTQATLDRWSAPGSGVVVITTDQAIQQMNQLFKK